MSHLDILTLDNWLSYFKSPKLTYKEFIKKAKVYTLDGNVSILDFHHDSYGKLSSDQLRLLYEKCVLDKDEYLRNFYNNNLLIPDDISMEGLQPILNNTKHPHLKILVRNLYFLDILQKTEDLKKRSYMNVIIDLYKYYIIDRYLLAPSVLKMISNNKFNTLLAQMYFRASIMNPFLVYSLSTVVLQNPKRVLTPCLGWSSYLLGFMENPSLQHYVGIDVIKTVCDTTKQLATTFRPDIKCDIYCKPSEDLYKDGIFMSKYRGYFDTVFFCPPYYQLELYDGKDQSTERYESYDEWLTQYWDATIKLCYYCLKKGGELCYIVSGYTVSGNNYLDLDTDMNNIIINNKFIYLDEYPMSKQVKYIKHGTKKRNRFNETIYLFNK